MAKGTCGGSFDLKSVSGSPRTSMPVMGWSAVPGSDN